MGVVDAALEEAAESLGLTGGALAPSELAAVGVTQGPGLVGALVVGVAFAKGFAYAAGKPLICVNHLEGHLFANKLTTPDLEPPFIFTLVSGGHTMLVHVRAWGDYEVLGETLDDAVGEAFDKVAKALGLGYPGGPVISRLAETGNPKAIDFPRALNSKGDYRFSLSGLKTAVTLYIEQETAAGRTISLPDLAASFEAAVFDVQYKKAKNALRETGAREYCIGGGVAANPHLRRMMIEKLGRQGIRVTVPPQKRLHGQCGDDRRGCPREVPPRRVRAHERGCRPEYDVVGSSLGRRGGALSPGARSVSLLIAAGGSVRPRIVRREFRASRRAQWALCASRIVRAPGDVRSDGADVRRETRRSQPCNKEEILLTPSR